MEEPFTIFKVMPREPIPLSDTTLVSLNVGGNLLTHEVDRSIDFFEFFQNLVRLRDGDKRTPLWYGVFLPCRSVIGRERGYVCHF
jgi:hypothetical protein